ncbi:thermonuclease family protein [Candidatus Methylomirabilis sp.]|uniref:thermonuclease family protein n=1 Tax=Candidatus Methylomirabilis sp. TaxID=2032687 RepID=UPI002A68DCE9|nr:thermonuclease family protein [Candidatus Methylomirabilis sp.]
MTRRSKWVERLRPWRMSWRRLSLPMLVLIGVLSCAACNTSYARDERGRGAAALTAPVAANELVRVKRIYDGDTVLLEDGRTVRYLGINAPEYQEPFYLKAKRLNESLVTGREIRLEFDQERTDGYGRVLAYVYAGNEMINARLVQEGLAHTFFIGPNRTHHTLLLRLQAEAQQRKIGIWSARGRVRDLKITNVHPVDLTQDDQYPSYVRIANLSNTVFKLAGYVLSNEARQRYIFPDVSVDPGYTVIVSSGSGTNGVDARGQLVVHWSTQGPVWDPREDTAFLTDPSGNLVDTFHYKGKRVRSSGSRSKVKTP